MQDSFGRLFKTSERLLRGVRRLLGRVPELDESRLSEHHRFAYHDRRDVFVATGRKLGIAEQNVEKDFWVCRTLAALFQDQPKGSPRLLFKGEPRCLNIRPDSTLLSGPRYHGLSR